MSLYEASEVFHEVAPGLSVASQLCADKPSIVIPNAMPFSVDYNSDL